MNIEIRDLMLRANEIRRLAIDMIYNAQSGHPGGSLSSADILSALYFKVLRVDPKNPLWEERDRFVLSKGHASAAYYAALALRGFFPLEDLKTFRKIGSMLQGHPTIHVPGVDMTTGSLGQGFSNSLGMALSAKIDKKDYLVYVLLGDGECNEGIVWEAALSAAHNNLDNIIAILDRNMYQLDGATEKILSLEPLQDKFRAFGWNVFNVDGHNIEEILNAIDMAKRRNGKPNMIIARTIKGKGVSFMENTHEFHGKAPNKEQYERAIKELDEIEHKIKGADPNE
ncbi:MAG: transketolase [Thermoplasmata archaeon]|jgi:transketolase|nr:MAG: transketolase [Aciduliprofundum sp.]